jgi:biopolymer transport protein ExbB/TolQ
VFTTVRGIVNRSIAFSTLRVAPGIAEALLVSAFGLAAAIPPWC